MKKAFIISVLYVILFSESSFAQNSNSIISKTETERIEKYLASDELEGRQTFSKGIEKAADFISNEFAAVDLEKFKNSNSYLQNFSMIKPKYISLNCVLDNITVDPKEVVVVTTQANLAINEQSNYEIATIQKTENLFGAAYKFLNAHKNYIVLVDESFAPNFLRLAQFKQTLSEDQSNVIYLLTNKIPTKFSIQATHTITQLPLSNVVALLPGKTLPNEYVIFSGHYDHLGINGKKAVNGDSLFNGANDDAAGTTAMIMLSKYFKQLNNNARTIVFVAFTAEESGGFGAKYFSKQFDPLSVKAMFNLEMIGTESKWGKNSAYITGFEKSDMGAILQKNLAGSAFQFYPDPYPDQNLFYRSDNATLAKLGVPAHTISTSKMDNEPNYHKPSDQFETIDIDNMTEIIKAIALSSKTIISGKDSPTRVDTTLLK